MRRPVHAFLPVPFVFAGGTAETFEEALTSIYANRSETVTGLELRELMDAGVIGDGVDPGNGLTQPSGSGTHRVHGSIQRWGRWVRNQEVEVVY